MPIGQLRQTVPICVFVHRYRNSPIRILHKAKAPVLLSAAAKWMQKRSVCDSAVWGQIKAGEGKIFPLSHTTGYIRRPQRHKLEFYNYTWVNRWQVGVGISLSPAGTSLQINKRSVCGWCYNGCGGGGGLKIAQEHEGKAWQSKETANATALPLVWIFRTLAASTLVRLTTSTGNLESANLSPTWETRLNGGRKYKVEDGRPDSR